MSKEKWGYTIIETEEGVLIQVENGDTQYLTHEEYELFVKNRQNSDEN